MMDDSKQAAESYDNTHRMEQDAWHAEEAMKTEQARRAQDRMEQLDAFTEQTIASVDGYLHGEREAEIQDAMRTTALRLEANAAKAKASEEDDPLCWRCGQPESEHYGLSPSYCDPWDEDYGGRDEKRVFQGEPWDAEASDPSGWTQGQREEYSQALDEEYNDYWNQHCVKHGESLREDGSCVQCEAELADERRNDL